MIVKALGILDLVAGLVFLLSVAVTAMPKSLIIICAVYFLIKGSMFMLLMDFASIVDFICGIIILLSAWTEVPLVLSIIALIFIAQKGILSLIS